MEEKMFEGNNSFESGGNELIEGISRKDKQTQMDSTRSDGPLKLTVAWRDGTFEILVGLCCTVSEIKQRLEKLTRVSRKRQKLVGLGKAGLKHSDASTLASLKLPIKNDAYKITMVGTPDDELFEFEKTAKSPKAPVYNDFSHEFTPATKEWQQLQEFSEKTQFHFINEPRPDRKLLVLDLDHTLLDFSLHEDVPASAMKRPYFDQFLADVYPYYDVAIWSQTSWKWLELKITELGMMSNESYRVCFVLDKSNMFRLESGGYVKPLHIIWSRFPERWSNKNTLHVDDVARNFMLNPQSGIKVSSFYRYPRSKNSSSRSVSPSSRITISDTSTSSLPTFSSSLTSADAASASSTMRTITMVDKVSAAFAVSQCPTVSLEAPASPSFDNSSLSGSASGSGPAAAVSSRSVGSENSEKGSMTSISSMSACSSPTSSSSTRSRPRSSKRRHKKLCTPAMIGDGDDDGLTQPAVSGRSHQRRQVSSTSTAKHHVSEIKTFRAVKPREGGDIAHPRPISATGLVADKVMHSSATPSTGGVSLNLGSSSEASPSPTTAIRSSSPETAFVLKTQSSPPIAASKTLAQSTSTAAASPVAAGALLTIQPSSRSKRSQQASSSSSSSLSNGTVNVNAHHPRRSRSSSPSPSVAAHSAHPQLRIATAVNNSMGSAYAYAFPSFDYSSSLGGYTSASAADFSGAAEIAPSPTDDRELLFLSRYLLRLATLGDISGIDHSCWRKTASDFMGR